MFTSLAAQTMIKAPSILRRTVVSEASKLLIDQVLELTEAERAIVAEQILLSLNQPNAEIDAIWVTETEARLDAYEKGQLESVSANEVLGKYDGG